MNYQGTLGQAATRSTSTPTIANFEAMFPPGEPIAPRFTRDERAAHYVTQYTNVADPMPAIQDLAAYTERLAKHVEELYGLGKRNFTSPKVRSMLTGIEDMHAREIAIKQTYNPSLLSIGNLKPAWDRYHAAFWRVQGALDSIQDWTTEQGDLELLKPAIIEQAVAQGNLDIPEVIPPEMKAHYIRISYEHPTFSQSAPAAAIRESYDEGEAAAIEDEEAAKTQNRVLIAALAGLAAYFTLFR